MVPITPGGHGLGWRGPSPADPRDYLYAPSREDAATLPASVDLTAQMGPVRNQFDEGACTGFAACKVARQAYTEDGWRGVFEPAPRYVYWNERAILQTTGEIPDATQQDTGGYGRVVMQTIARYGITAETNCPYTPPDGKPLEYLTTAPTPAAFANGYKHLAATYHAVTLEQITVQALLAQKHSFFAGITVYASFEGAQASQTGIIPMPRADEQILGGHELPFIGYHTDGAQLYVKFMNSWDTSWGDRGFGYLPIQYLVSPSLCSDAWTILVQR